MRTWFRLQDRLFGAIVAVFAVTSAISCIVAIATGQWVRLPVELIVALAATFLLLVRRRARRAVAANEPPRADGRSASSSEVDDPGWELDPRALLASSRRSSPTPGGGALTVMRYLFLAFSAALVSFVFVVANLPDTTIGSPWPWLIALGGISIACGVFPNLAERPLDDASAAALFASYRARFLLRVAFAETIALFAFTFTFLGAPPWIFYLACTISLARLWTNAAPTRAALARDQAALEARGSRLSLVAVLTAGSPDD